MTKCPAGGDLMLTKMFFRADVEPGSLSNDLSAAIVVVLLSVLFAAAIVAAMAPHPLVDAGQAALQGGL